MHSKWKYQVMIACMKYKIKRTIHDYVDLLYLDEDFEDDFDFGDDEL